MLLTDANDRHLSTPQNSKALSSPSVYAGGHEFLSTYRYTLGSSNMPCLSATVTSNVIEAQTKDMQYPSSIMNCKISPESYATSATNDNSPLHPNMSQYYKHWIWSRNLFCPQLSNANYIYSNGNAFLSSSLNNNSNNNDSNSNLNHSPGHITEINSDDSTESSEHDQVILIFNTNKIHRSIFGFFMKLKKAPFAL